MTATQFTGGSYKHTDPSNYSTGKQGAEVTIHWSVRDGADGSEQRSIGEEARVEAIRLAMGADQPYLLSCNTLGKSENPTPAVLVVPPTVPAVSPQTNVVQMPAAQSVPTVEVAGPLAQTSPSSGPLSVPGTTAVPAVVGSVTAATITSPSPESVPEEITDVRLNEAIDHCLKRIHAAAPMDTVSQETAGRKIPALIARYVAPPATFTKIPQEKRAQFMADLELMSTTVGHQKRILDADPNKAPAIGALVNAFVPAGGVLYDLPTENRQQFIDQLAAL